MLVFNEPKVRKFGREFQNNERFGDRILKPGDNVHISPPLKPLSSRAPLLNFVNLYSERISMDLLLSVPEGLSRHLLLEWLDIKDIAQLDHAYLCVAEKFHNLASSPQSVFLNVDRMNTNTATVIAYTQWLVNRRFRVRSVFIPVELESNMRLMNQFFHLCGQVLYKVTIQRDLRGQYGDALFLLFLEHCHNLQDLTLEGTYPRLHCPIIQQMTPLNGTESRTGLEKGFNTVKFYFPVLRRFYASGIPLSDNELEAVAVGSPGLEELILDGAYYVTEQSLAAVANNCLKLHTVKLAKMWISDANILPIVTLCNNLCSIDISRAHITDQSLTSIALNCRSLHRLLLKECDKITDNGVDSVLCHCTRLHELTLDANILLSDATLYSIAKHRPLLTQLCWKVRHYSSGLAEVAQACTQLQQVIISTGRALSVSPQDLFAKHVEVVVNMDSRFTSAEINHLEVDDHVFTGFEMGGDY